MSPYFAFRRHPNLYRFSVKLLKMYTWTRLAFTIPAAALWRKRYCFYVDSIPGLPIYLDKCEQDLSVGRSLFESAFRFMDEKSPIWGKRARRLFKRVLICDKVDVVAYLPEQKCCAVNPWIIVRARNSVQAQTKTAVVHLELAGFIVYATCLAFLWEHHAAYLDKQSRKIACWNARIRFLFRCLDIHKDDTTLARIKNAEIGDDFINLGIKNTDPVMISAVSGIQGAQKHINKAEAAKGKRRRTLWNLIREMNSLP